MTKTKGNIMTNEITDRRKSQLRYAIKTKCFADTNTTLKGALNVASDWVTFRKSDFLYKHSDYVAGADFNPRTGSFTYFLKTDGTIVMIGGHTNWTRIF